MQTLDAPDQKKQQHHISHLIEMISNMKFQSQNIWQNLPDEEYHEPACEACLQPDMTFSPTASIFSL